jgi:hypothetical protein
MLSAGCSGDEDAADGATTTEATTTTTESTTSTTAALPDQPPLLDDAVSGSGCTPGADEELTDGWWYGALTAPVTEEVVFDLACYYVGAAAEAEATSRGDEVNNDYYVVNENPQRRALTVASGATASCVELGAGVEMVDCSSTEVAGDWAVWLRVRDGDVDRIVEQYAP